jgi:hypothetical protein
VKRAGAGVAVVLVVAAGACAADQEEQPMRTGTTTQARPADGGAAATDKATDPAEPITELVAAADLVVTGSVIEVTPAVDEPGARTFGAQTATIEVQAGLKGDVAPGKLVIAKPESSYFLTEASDARGDRKARSGGIFVLRNTGDTPTLFGHVGVHDHEFAPQWFARALAGLPATLPPPTTAQLTEWVDRADVVVFAAATGDAGRVETRTPRLDWAGAGTLEPIEVLKGDLPGSVEVVRGPQPELPGGTWAFPVQKERTGVFFLDTSTSPATVINTAAPWDVFAQQVRRLLGR